MWFAARGVPDRPRRANPRQGPPGRRDPAGRGEGAQIVLRPGGIVGHGNRAGRHPARSVRHGSPTPLPEPARRGSPIRAASGPQVSRSARFRRPRSRPVRSGREVCGQLGGEVRRPRRNSRRPYPRIQAQRTDGAGMAHRRWPVSASRPPACGGGLSCDLARGKNRLIAKWRSLPHDRALWLLDAARRPEKCSWAKGCHDRRP